MTITNPKHKEWKKLIHCPQTKAFLLQVDTSKIRESKLMPTNIITDLVLTQPIRYQYSMHLRSGTVLCKITKSVVKNLDVL